MDERVRRGKRWQKVGGLPLWRKFSLVLWSDPAEAVRVLPPIRIAATAAAVALEKRKQAGTTESLTWTSVLIRALALTLSQHPEWNRFVRKNRIYTRENVDALLRVNLEDGSLWACYIRGAQTKTVVALRRHVDEHRAKIRARGARYPILSSFVELLPVSLLRALYRAYDWFENRTGLGIPGMPDLRYPSFSMSNLGSLKTVLIPPLVTRGLHAPIHLTVGAAESAAGSTALPVIFAFDHRIIDAGGVGTFVAALESVLADPKFLAEIAE